MVRTVRTFAWASQSLNCPSKSAGDGEVAAGHEGGLEVAVASLDQTLGFGIIRLEPDQRGGQGAGECAGSFGVPFPAADAGLVVPDQPTRHSAKQLQQHPHPQKQILGQQLPHRQLERRERRRHHRPLVLRRPVRGQRPRDRRPSNTQVPRNPPLRNAVRDQPPDQRPILHRNHPANLSGWPRFRPSQWSRFQASSTITTEIAKLGDRAYPAPTWDPVSNLKVTSLPVGLARNAAPDCSGLSGGYDVES